MKSNYKSKFLKRVKNATIGGLAAITLAAGCATPASIQKRRNFYNEANDSINSYTGNKNGSFVDFNFDEENYQARFGIKGNFDCFSDIPKEMAGAFKANAYGLVGVADLSTWKRPFTKEGWQNGQKAETIGVTERYIAILASIVAATSSGGSSGSRNTQPTTYSAPSISHSESRDYTAVEDTTSTSGSTGGTTPVIPPTNPNPSTFNLDGTSEGPVGN